MRNGAAKAYLGLIWIFFVGVIVQFFLAGIGVFYAKNPSKPADHWFDSSSFDAHGAWGTLLQLISILLVIAVLLWRPNGQTIGLTVLLLALMILQSVLVHASTSTHWLQALHPLNGVLILGLSYMLAQRARALNTASSAAEPAPAPTAA
jgi:Family of unknown function (DUF6220)